MLWYKDEPPDAGPEPDAWDDDDYRQRAEDEAIADREAAMEDWIDE